LANGYNIFIIGNLEKNGRYKMRNTTQTLLLIIILSLFTVLNYKILVKALDKNNIAYQEKSTIADKFEGDVRRLEQDLRSSDEFQEKRCVCLMYDINNSEEDFERNIPKREICSYKPNAGVFHPETGYSLLTK
jgi:hypothetical protein